MTMGRCREAQAHRPGVMVGPRAYNWGTHMIRYSNPRDTFTTLLQGGKRSFSCNHMPVIVFHENC
jgi:hypothetical protein